MFLRHVLLLFLLSSALTAQVATLTGRITDPSGAVVPGASVAAKNQETGIVTNTESTSEGYYTLASLPPGHYEVTISKPGFGSTKQTGLELAVQQVARLDVTLSVGQVSEAVNVTAAAPLLDSESATVGQVIGSRQVSELPLLGRNTYALAMLVPGVRPSSGVNNLVIDQISTVAYSINGQRSNSNEFLLDGAPNSAPAQNQPVINANPDMVQEFKVETNSYSAEYGRAAGGVFNVVTRSGSNEPHFSLYEFFRNDKLNANDFFANRAGTERAPFRFNQFGGTFGGPLYIPKLYDGRNKTFFFGNVELVRFIQGVTYTAVLPDPQQLTGDFSNARLADGRPVTIYDPATTRPNPSGSGFLRDAFPGNIIPANRIDPVARNVARLFAAPTIPGTPLGAVNYTRTDGNKVNKDSYSLRGDHYFTSANHAFARYSYDDTPFERAPVYGREFQNVAPTAGPQIFTRWNAVAEDSHTFSPTVLATVRYSVSRLINFRRPYSDNFDLESLGLPAYMRTGMRDPLSLPAMQITGYSAASSIPNIIVGGVIGATDLINFGNTIHSLMGSVNKSLASHSLKIGGEYRVIQFNSLQTTDTATNFNFTPQWTQGPNPATSSATAGLGLATFLLGIPQGGVNPAPALALTSKYYAVYLQDSWRATPRLTVNWGFRYDFESPKTDRFNQLTNFDYDAVSPVQGVSARGALTFVGTGDLPRGNANPDRNNFAPRLGIAYKLTPKTVIRTGAGLFYASTWGVGGGAGPFGTSGFQAGTNIVTSLDGVTPIVRWSDPYPGGRFNSPTGSSLGAATLLGQSVQFYDRGNTTPYSAQWNFTIQQELPKSIVLEVGYVGTRGVGMTLDRAWNQLPPETLALGDALRQQVPNPFFGQITVGSLAGATVPRAQLLRPYPQFDGVSSQQASWATSSYHGMTIRGEKRYASGVSVLMSYTWSKMMDYGTGPFGGESVGASTFQSNYNLRAEWSPSVLDQTHRWVANAVYELPFFKSSTKTLARTILGGWQVGGIWSWLSGGPLGVSSAVNNTFSQGGGQRPNWNGQNPCVADPTPQRWLDQSVFSNPPAYQFGSAPRTFNGCRSDITSQIDLTLTKNTRFQEKWNVQFRAESFNLTNTARFAPPNQVFGNPQFGVVNSQGNQPRVIQFGLKLIR